MHSQKKGTKSHVKTTVDVFARSGEVKLTIPKSDVHYMPDTKGAGKKPVLCARYDPHGENSDEHGCPFATTGTCRYVHADTRNAQSHVVHVNYAYRAAEDCAYERHPAGAVFTVYLPNTAGNADCAVAIPSEHALVTKCLYNDKRHVACHCAHFYYGRECHQGNKCCFAHVITLDEAAKPGKRATALSRPAPVALLRGSPKNNRSWSSVASEFWASEAPSAIFPRSGRGSSAASEHGDLLGALAMAAVSSDDELAHMPQKPHRFRHNPYNALGFTIDA